MKQLWANINHPCYEIDLTEFDSDDDYDPRIHEYIPLNELRHIVGSHARILKLLGRIEWVKEHGGFGTPSLICPACRHQKRSGHAENCELDLLLNKREDGRTG